MSKTETVEHVFRPPTASFPTGQTVFTPGPWDDASNYPEFNSVRIFAGTHYIATVGNSDDAKEQTEANARLIAAAPELLAELKEILAAYSDIPDREIGCHLAHHCDKARAAIQKAEGRA